MADPYRTRSVGDHRGDALVMFLVDASILDGKDEPRAAGRGALVLGR